MLTFLIFQIQKAATKSRVFGTMEVLEMSRYHPGRALFSVLHLMLAMLTDLRSIFPSVGFSRLLHQPWQTDLSSGHTSLTHFHSLLCMALCTDALLSHAHSGTFRQIPPSLVSRSPASCTIESGQRLFPPSRPGPLSWWQVH